MAVGTHSSRRTGGVTLVELLLVLVVAGILLGLAAPSLSAAVDSARLTALTNDMLAELLLARSEAVRRGHPVVLCKASTDSVCARSGRWDQGWLMFKDFNHNAEREANEPVLRQRAGAPAGWRIVGNGPVARYVAYHPLGGTQLSSGAFQAGTLTICRQAGSVLQARQIVINSSGRPRVQPAPRLPAACV